MTPASSVLQHKPLSYRPLDRYDPSVSVKRCPTVELIGAAHLAAR